MTLITLAASARPAAADAQAPAPVETLVPGARVRVRAPAVAPDPLVGAYRWQTTDSLAFDTDRRITVAIPRSYVQRMDVLRGESRWQGAGRGTLWGAAAGAGVALLVNSFHKCETFCEGQRSKRTRILRTVGVGAGLGVTFGAFNPTQHWERVAVPSPVRSRPSASDAGSPR
jgi:hypothetical protein